MFSLILQAVGAFTLAMLSMGLLIHFGARAHRGLKAAYWRRAYETAYEREVRKIARSAVWKHRFRLPDLPSSQNIQGPEEDAVRRARSYYE